ncbi:alpha/beta-hydrolase [Cristinia sonorae]|uniref:Alpha/beta-hydrolase n=1 Tax=Cristinia sonorae TaxID=1940300 RepID=A0A8K0UZ75_9AGAR|nr:alpha/beta-hydrolase [Cristinia sonorae]
MSSVSSGSEKPFKLSVSDADLDLLHKKLALTTLPDELDGAGWNYGAPLAHVTRLLDRWKNGFDWRASEAAINKIPQFTRDIDVEGFGTLNVHYAHQRSQAEDAIPLLFIHGWPGHFMEGAKLIPLLTTVTPGEPSFHFVALSLPAFGFSEAPTKTGFAISQHAEVGNKLMLALGYNKYVVQGGDWGYFITRKMGKLYGKKHVQAWHTNFPIATFPPITYPRHFVTALVTSLLPSNIANLKEAKKFGDDGRGYFAIQSTRPQTLAYSLRDSPVGLLAWIYEKLVAWTDSYPWTDDEVLTWISIYWFSRGGPDTSVRLYYEAMHAEGFASDQPWSPVPIGFSRFPKEIVTLPKSWSRALGNVVFEADHDQGGHFAAYERPEALAGDLKKMFGKGGVQVESK